MSQDYSREALLGFLDCLGNKGLMNRATVSSRKAAVNTLLSILDEEEASDLRGLDVRALLQRFSNLKGNEFKPDSLKVYRSRLNSVLEDFESYKKDPLGFKPASHTRERTARSPRSESGKSGSESSATDRDEGNRVHLTERDEISSIVFPIPIRPGVIVKVAGIPSDLTVDEAEKIGRVILALSGSQEP